MSSRRPATRGPGARVPITDQPPPRIMVVSCPELRSPELSSPELRSQELSCPELGDADTSGPDLAAARLLEQVIAVVTGFCPKVEVVEPGVCAFGARGPARYFGGETALAARIIAAVADLGVESRVSVANGLFAALLAARITNPAAANPARAVRRHAILVVPPGETAQFLAAQPVSVLAARDLAARDLYPGVLDRTVALGRQCAFDFRVIAPSLPDFGVSAGHTEASWLRELVARNAPARYGPPGAERVPGAYSQIARELDVIERLEFSGYFLIVHNIVEFCEDHDILCQGRGSAANSAVCFALGITNVNPVSHHLLFERFLSDGRDGPPDIDLDIEHRRREEVIQYVYRQYGRAGPPRSPT